MADEVDYSQLLDSAISRPGQLQSVLRPEPQRLFWDSLDVSQQIAFCRIIEQLHEAAGEVGAKSTDGSPRDRRSVDIRKKKQLLWLEGGRGMGKTTLLESVKFALTCTIEWDANIQKFAKRGDSSARQIPQGDTDPWSESLMRYRSITNAVEQLRGRVIWLEPLEMELLPGPTNLLASILARIQKSVGRENDDEVPRSVLERRSSADQALMDLSKLMADVSLAWDGNAMARAGNVDPDTFAREVNRAETARLDVPRKYAKVLEDLATKAGWGRSIHSPMFVLPIDDCDLSAERALEILRLLQVFQSPRLFTIVLGDIEHTERILQLKLTGDMAKVADVELTAEITQQPFYHRQHPLMIEAMRKLVPPGQRIKLEPMNGNEILRYRPYDDQHRIQDFLEQIRFEMPPSISISSRGSAPGSSTQTWSLRQFLEKSAFESSTAETPSDEGPWGKLPSSGTFSKFGLPPRRVADAWYQLCQSQTSSVNGRDQALRLAVNQFRDCIEASQSLDPRDTKSALGLLYESAEGSGYWQLRTAQVCLSWLHPRPDQFETDLEKRPKYVDRSVEFQFDGHWRVSLIANRDLPPQLLDERSTAMFLLAHDLIQLEPKPVATPSLTQGDDTNSPVSMVWRRPSAPPIRVPWPTPNFALFWEWDHFLTLWSQALSRSIGLFEIGQFETRVERMAFVWMSAAVALFDQKGLSDLLPPLAESDSTFFELNWPSLANRIQGCAKAVLEWQSNRVRRTLVVRRWVLAREWLRGLALLLAPESGLPPPISYYFCQSTMLGLPGAQENSLVRLWRESSDWIRTQRCRAAARFPFDSSKHEAFFNELFGLREPSPETPQLLTEAVDEVQQFVWAIGDKVTLFAPRSDKTIDRTSLRECLKRLMGSEGTSRSSVKRSDLDVVIKHLRQLHWIQKLTPDLMKQSETLERHIWRAMESLEKADQLANLATSHPINQMEELCPSLKEIREEIGNARRTAAFNGRPMESGS